MKTLIPQIDKVLQIKPGDIVLAGGFEDAIESMVSGLVMTAEHVQWVKLSDKPFVAPKPNVDVFDWNGQDRDGKSPEPNTLHVLDGIQENISRFNWDQMLPWMVDLAKTNLCSFLVIAVDADGTRLDPKAFLPENVVEVFRQHNVSEIMFAQRHFSEVQCVIRSEFDEVGDCTETTQNLGPAGELLDSVIKNVHAAVKPPSEKTPSRG